MNPAQVLARFAGAARDETDRERLVSELSPVIQGTLQPDNRSVWMKRWHNVGRLHLVQMSKIQSCSTWILL